MPRPHADRTAFQAPHPVRTRCAPLSAHTPTTPLRAPPARRARSARRQRARPTSVDTSTRPPAAAAPRFDAHSSALQQGIKSVAVGKHGSRPVPSSLFPALHAELALCEQPSPPQELLWLRASFLGSLFVKRSLSVDEMRLLVRWCGDAGVAAGRRRVVGEMSVSAGEVLAAVCDTTSGELCVFAMRVLCDERLDVREAATLGALLYRREGDWALKALIAHVMRVRHEDELELAGLSVAARESVNERFSRAARSKHVYALLAEPYDGTQAWELLTPLVARHLHARYGMRVVLGVGESSGPKYGPNLRDVARELRVPFARDGAALTRLFDDGEAMVAVDQRDVSDGLSAWVKMRRVIVKRPAIASAEKFADAVTHGCDLFVASVFHDSYLEKMARAAEANGYARYVIVSRGVEGTIGVGVSSSKKHTVLLSGRRTADGYVRRKTTADAVAAAEGESGRARGDARAERTARLVSAFCRGGQSGDALFDRRVGATLRALDDALRAAFA